MGTDDGTTDTAAAVAANLKAVRRRRGLTVRQLSDRLKELGAPILPSGITKIEQGDRRVDVNDLMALAAALNVSPARLLLPDVGERDLIKITPNMPPQELWLAWDWMEGDSALAMDGLTISRQTTLEYAEARPAWMRLKEQHPLMRASQHLNYWVRLVLGREGVVQSSTDESSREPDPHLLKNIEAAREALHGVSQALDRVESEATHRGER